MSTETKILAVVGSPRIGGNTDVLVDEVLAGAEEKGAVTEKIYLGRSTIGPCHACDACEGTGVCFQRDDMDHILQRMEDSDIWVLGTPVYWWGATAQFKLFLDRWYGPWHDNEPKKAFQNKKIALVITMGDTDASTADPTLNMFVRSFDYIGLELAATLLAPGVYGFGDAEASNEIMRNARDAGQLLACS